MRKASRQPVMVSAATVLIATVRPRSERLVVSRAREIGVRAYAPRLLEHRSGGPVETPMFPGYVFFWIRDEHRKVRTLSGVFDFVRIGESPAHVRQCVIDELRSHENAFGFVVVGARFREGDRVRVGAEGPLGICVGYSDKMRVRVLLEILGREVEMRVPQGELVAA